MNDLVGSFDTDQEAIDHHVEYLKQEEDWEFIKDVEESFESWYECKKESIFAHVFDTETMTKVWSWGADL